MSDFYLTLPSNSSMDYYKANTLANFTTRLPNTIDLTGDWEVGLVEIQYLHNWYNVPAEESCRTFRVRCQSADNENGPQAAYDFMIPAGYYHRVQTMLNQIEEKANHVLKSTNSTINLNYDKISRKVSMERSLCRLTLPPHIRKKLGMTMVSSFANNQSKADSVVDMDPVDSLYIYCDVVEPRVVGDKQFLLLRIVPAEGDHGQLMTQIYENVHYVRLQRKSFQTIEIDIRDRTEISCHSSRGRWTWHFISVNVNVSLLCEHGRQRHARVFWSTLSERLWSRPCHEKHSPSGYSPSQTCGTAGTENRDLCGSERSHGRTQEEAFS